jgi:hypothetical protein
LRTADGMRVRYAGIVHRAFVFESMSNTMRFACELGDRGAPSTFRTLVSPFYQQLDHEEDVDCMACISKGHPDG